MKWRETEFEDLHRIELPMDPDDSDIRGVLPDTEENRHFIAHNARTWVDGDQILAIIGISPMWKGVGSVWTLITDEARSHGVSFTRGVLRLLEVFHVEQGYWRMQATVVRGDEAARLWIVRLGFTYEGTMIGYGPDGRTHDMYARLRGL